MAAKGYASDLNDAQWALIERTFRRRDAGAARGRWTSARSSTPSSICSEPGGRPLATLADHRTVIADAGHQSRKLAAEIKRHEGWRLVIVKRSEPAFKIVGLNWIVERTFGWLGRHRRLSKDYEFKVQTSETLIEIAGIRTMLNRLAPA